MKLEMTKPWRNAWEQEYLTIQDHCRAVEVINPNFLADVIMKRETIITLDDTQEILLYNKQTGLYERGEEKLSWCIQFCSCYKAKTHLVNETLASLRRQTGCPREIIGADLNLIPLNNGIFNFETNEFIQFNEKYIFQTKHKINYKPKEELEDFQENPIDTFLNQVTEKPEDALFLKEYIGYCFYRAMPFHTFVIIVGAGGNGKSVFLNILREMIGRENISERTLQELADDRFGAADLYGKNANIVGDLPRKALEDTGLLKRVTGNDVVTAQRKYEASFTFRPYAKIICAANEAPESPDMSTGFLRRTQIINFPNNFEGKENRNLAQELCTEDNLSRFFFSCIDAFKQAMTDNQWIITESISKKEEKYINYSNSGVAFCTNLLEFDPDSELTCSQIWDKYKEYCTTQKLILRKEPQFFTSLYAYFQKKVWKKRSSVSNSPLYDKPIREYVIVGVCWK